MMTERNKKNLSLIPVPVKKGASRGNSKKNNYWQNFSLSKAIVVTSVMTAIVIFYVCFLAVETVLNVPVNQVDFESDFKYLSEAEITKVIDGYVTNGFLTVDLKKLQLEFKKLPWVYSANIKRKLPNGLSVALEEQKPMAYWNDNAMVNANNDLFFPDVIPQLDGLPKFRGTNYKNTMQVYKHLLQVIPKSQQPITALAIDERNTIKVTIKSKTDLILNTEKLTDQIGLWKKIFESGLGNRLQEVVYVDLRYSNGAAVQFSNIVSGDNKSKLGL